jgi:succinate dehydrogenase hydrophobic anchor subunit
MKKNKYILTLVFFIIPYLGLVASWDAITTFASRWQQISFDEAVRANYTKIKYEGNDLTYLARQLNQSYGLLSEDKLARENIAKSIEILRGLGLDFFKLRFFDEKGETIVIPGEDDAMRLILKSIFQALVEPETKGTQNLAKRNHAYINAFLGSIGPAELISEKSNLIEVNIKGEKGYFYWNTFYTADETKNYQGGMFAWCLAREVTEHFSKKNIINQINTQALGSEKWGILNFHNPELSYPVNRNLDQSRLFKLFKEMRVEKKLRHRLGKNTLFLFPLSKNKSLYCIQTPSESSFKVLGLLFLAALAIFMLYGIRHIFSKERDPANFKAATGLAHIMLLSFLLVLAVGLLWSGRAVALELAKRELRLHLDEIDLAYELTQEDLEQAYEDLLKAADTPLQGLDLKKAHASGLFETFYGFSNKGALKYAYPQAQGLDLMVQLLQPVVKKIFSAHSSNARSLAKQLKDSFYQKISQDMLASIDGASELMRSLETLNSLNELWLVNKKYYVYSALIENHGAKEPLLVMLWHKDTRLAEQYLQQRVAAQPQSQAASSSTLALDKHAVKLFVMDLTRDEPPYPLEYSRYSFPKEIKRRVLEAGSGQAMQAEAGFERLYVLGLAMRTIPNKLAVAIAPFNSVLREYNQLCWALAVTVFCFLWGSFLIKKL